MVCSLEPNTNGAAAIEANIKSECIMKVDTSIHAIRMYVAHFTRCRMPKSTATFQTLCLLRSYQNPTFSYPFIPLDLNTMPTVYSNFFSLPSRQSGTNGLSYSRSVCTCQNPHNLPHRVVPRSLVAALQCWSQVLQEWGNGLLSVLWPVVAVCI